MATSPCCCSLQRGPLPNNPVIFFEVLSNTISYQQMASIFSNKYQKWDVWFLDWLTAVNQEKVNKKKTIEKNIVNSFSVAFWNEIDAI